MRKYTEESTTYETTKVWLERPPQVFVTQRLSRLKCTNLHGKYDHPELLKYLQNNADSLPNYGKRWRNGQRICCDFDVRLSMI